MLEEKQLMAILIANNGNRVVETIAERDAIVKKHSTLSVTVKDATADIMFGGGLVNYVWDTVTETWLPTYASLKPELIFSTEEKPIVDNSVTTDFVVKDGIIWSAKIIDADGEIVADAHVTAVGSVITLSGGPWIDHTLHYTYAHGTMSTELFGLWESKAGLASPEFTGTPTVPTAAVGTDNDQVANTAFVKVAVDSKADIESPEFTGLPTAPTAVAGTESEQIANTAFVSDALKSVGFEKQEDGEGWKSNVKTDAYTVKVEPPSEVSGGEIDLDSQQVVVFNGTINQNITLTNPPGADRAMTMVIKFKGKGGTITWPAGILWAEDKVPELSDTFTVVVLLWDGEEWVGSTGLKR